MRKTLNWEWTTSFHFQEIFSFYLSKMLWCYSFILALWADAARGDELLQYVLSSWSSTSKKATRIKFFKALYKKQMMSMGKRRVAEKKVRATQHGQRAWNHQITLWDIHTEEKTAARATTTKNNGFFLLYGALSIAERFIFSPQSTICERDAVVHCNCWCDDVIFILRQTFAFGHFIAPVHL